MVIVVENRKISTPLSNALVKWVALEFCTVIELKLGGHDRNIKV